MFTRSGNKILALIVWKDNTMNNLLDINFTDLEEGSIWKTHRNTIFIHQIYRLCFHFITVMIECGLQGNNAWFTLLGCEYHLSLWLSQCTVVSCKSILALQVIENSIFLQFWSLHFPVSPKNRRNFVFALIIQVSSHY